MKQSLYLLPLLTILAFTLSGCELISDLTVTTDLTDNTSPAAVLFEDDFSDQSSGWSHIADDTGYSLYTTDAQFGIYIEEADVFIYDTPGKSFPNDVVIEVDASGLSELSEYGIICRFQRDTRKGNAYFGSITNDGYYAISKVIDDDIELIGMDDFMPSDLIRTWDTNRIRFDCIGDTLTLWVNGEKLAEVQDSDFQGGDIGLIAGSIEEDGGGGMFDNLVVKNP
jgi:hypothetical protein